MDTETLGMVARWLSQLVVPLARAPHLETQQKERQAVDPIEHFGADV